MGIASTPGEDFEFILREKGLTDKDIGWVLSKLDSHEYLISDCQYMAYLTSMDSPNKVKDLFIQKYFSLNINGLPREDSIKHLFNECLDKKKIWKILEKCFGSICIHLPLRDLSCERYLFICGPNKKCPDAIKLNYFVSPSQRNLNGHKGTNPLDKSSLRLIPS